MFLLLTKKYLKEGKLKVNLMEFAKRGDKVVLDVKFYMSGSYQKGHDLWEKTFLLKEILKTVFLSEKETIIFKPIFNPKGVNDQTQHIVVFTVICLAEKENLVMSKFKEKAKEIGLQPQKIYHDLQYIRKR